MADEDFAERSEQATPKRKQEARNKGQVARSKELTTALLLIFSAIGLYSFSGSVGEAFARAAVRAWSLSRKDLFSVQQMISGLGHVFNEVLIAVLPFFILLFLIAIFSPLLTGGLSFSFKAAAPKFSRLSPAKGLKRMFGVHALMELIKALAKVLLVSLAAYWVISSIMQELFALGLNEASAGIAGSIELITRSFLLIALSLLVVAFIDVPYQLWNHNKQLKMTKREVKDEYKETEGKPEVKSKVRQLQREMSQRRMMDAVPDADVVVTNPEHYAVAIKYDAMKNSAPIVVAKGADLLAMQIRKVALANDVSILSAPPLTRAIYYSTEIDQEIPHGLYLSVAQVLAYILQLKNYQKGKGIKPKLPEELPIPDELKR